MACLHFAGQQKAIPGGKKNSGSTLPEGAKWTLDRAKCLVTAYTEHALIWNSSGPGTTQAKHMTQIEKWNQISKSLIEKQKEANFK